MFSFFGGILGNTGLVEWVVGAAAAAFIPGAVNWFRKLGWDIDQVHAQQFQVAVTNAAGALIMRLGTGGLTAAHAGNIALELARVLIRDNPDTVKGLGIEKNPEKIAEKILAKVPQVSVLPAETSAAGLAKSGIR